MKTLSNDELQDAIMWAAKLIKGDNSKQDTILLVHLENLTDEQKKRATDELTLEPMTTTLERAEFDARVEAQDEPTPEPKHDRLASMFVNDLFAEGEPVTGPEIERIAFMSGPTSNDRRHGGFCKSALENWVSNWLKTWGDL